MREIKFRAWNRQHGGMIYDDILVLSHSKQPKNTTLSGTVYRTRKESEMDCIAPDYGTLDIMQFTGLHDKHGTEIYEGDIVKGIDDNGEMYWYDFRGNKHLCMDCGIAPVTFYAGMWYLNGQINNSLCDVIEISESHIEVIGNIYDNPELVEET